MNLISVDDWDMLNKKYRQSEQFKTKIKNKNVFKYWKEVGFPKQCRPKGDDDFVCD